MDQIADNNDKYIPLIEVADKCPGLAKKLIAITDKKKIENVTLEEELINRAINKKMYLYCFAPISKVMGKRWCFVWSDYLEAFFHPDASMRCSLLLVSKNDRIYFDLLVDSHPRLMDVSRSDLYLSLDELAEFENECQKIYDIKMGISDLTKKDDSFKIVSTTDKHNISEPTYSTNQTSSVINIDEPVDFLQYNDTFESAPSAALESKNDVISENQCSRANETVQESRIIAQVEKKKRTNRPIKKSEKIFTRNTDTIVEPSPLGINDREPLALKSFADLQARTLSLDEIIGNRKKGIPPIIPVSKSTWYAGVKSGRYPKSYEVSVGRVVWRGSDIYALLQEMGMV